MNYKLKNQNQMETQFDISRIILVKIFDRINRAGFYWTKPRVTLHLEHGLKVTKNFESYQTAVEWVDSLKAASGKTFDVIRKSNQ